MVFKTAKEIFAEKLKERGINSLKYLRRPGRGDVFNRAAYAVAVSKLKVVKREEFGDVHPGSVYDKCGGVSFLLGKGEILPDAVLLKTDYFEGINLLNVYDFKFPDVAVDMSFYKELTERERGSLINQIEQSFGVVKDFFTPLNFYLIDKDLVSINDLKGYFSPAVPFSILNEIPNEKRIIVLDPMADKDLSKEEVDEKTVFVFGGIVDHGERLRGATSTVYKTALHRRISYKGSISPVSDRISELTKILCRFLTSPLSLDDVVLSSLTRQGKLRAVKEAIQSKILRVFDNKGYYRVIFKSEFDKLRDEFNLNDFFFRKAGKHMKGFLVVKDLPKEKILKIWINKRGKECVEIEGEIDEFTIGKYP